MREIGSEFWDVPLSETGNDVFPDTVQWFLSGRSALNAIVAELGHCRSAALPSWCCDSMIRPFVDAGLEVRFYPVYRQDGLIRDIRQDCDILFLMDYFGYVGREPDLDGFGGTVIRDLTHAVFSAARTDADYCFGSLRKWCGVWTGGYAWTRDGHRLPAQSGDDHGYTALRREAMGLKESYICGRGVTDKSYLRLFDRAEEALEKVGIAASAERDVRLARELDAAGIISRRRANAAVLREAFPEWLIFPEMGEKDCPMFVPILVPDGKRNGLRRFLIENEIYCPIHWPESVWHRLDEKTRFLYENELSLVCDQRYSEEDMERMVRTIRAFREGA